MKGEQIKQAEKIFRENETVTCRQLIYQVPSNYPTSIIRDLKERHNLHIKRFERKLEGESFYRYYLEA